MIPVLTDLSDIRGDVQLPQYVPKKHGVGQVHLGMGAFHRSHQALMTDEALNRHGGDWRIAGVSLRSKDVATRLNAQNGLYTLLERGANAISARIVASIDHVIAADTQATLAALCNPSVRVVTLTVTEAGYGIDRQSRLPDMNNPVVANDLAQPDQAVGVLGLLVAAIASRRQLDMSAFTVLSCDNLPANGKLLRDAVIGFAQLAYNDELAHWISDHIAFPSSMVDRITPASTDATNQHASRLIGCTDLAAIETEPFIQWIIEDNFPTGRPQWEAGGALFVENVEPYERMKLTMLNGSHSMLAYCGFLTGKSTVREVMADDSLSALVRRHLTAAAALLEPQPGINYGQYAKALSERFENPAIAHQTYQIASDGTQKLPQRIFDSAEKAIIAQQSFRPFAFATAMWMRFLIQRQDDGAYYELKDPRAEEITDAIRGLENDAEKISDALHRVPELIPSVLASHNEWRSVVAENLSFALAEGCTSAVEREANYFCH